MEDKVKKVESEKIRKFSSKIIEIKEEVGKIIIGQDEVVDGVLRAVLCNGHVLLEGVPGLAKTLIIKSLGKITGCKTQRIQFTVDLLPTDILGMTIYTKEKGFHVIKGPIFSNFIIADEINRSPPKTQSALLEAMQEKQVTIGKTSFNLPLPFFVMATQNPIEVAGVYGLPEAQVDRFLFKLLINYPNAEEEKFIMRQNIDLINFEKFLLKKLISPEEIINMQKLVKRVYISPEIEDYIVRIVTATRDKTTSYSKYVEWGASPRASIGFSIASKAQALMNGRNFVNPQDVRNIAKDILRHRIILNYEAQADDIDSENIIDNLLNKTKTP